MANPEHFKIFRRGFERWNTWREKHPDVVADLSGADLRKQMLRGFDLSGSNLSKADMRDANLRRVDLNAAKLDGAKLFRVLFSATKLRDTSFNGAVLYETVFANVDLSTARGLTECVHKGPSVLDHRTLARSLPLPLVFLQGCGLPEDVISEALSPRPGLGHYYSCFISYSTKDQKFADRLYADLQEKGVRCWFAPHDMLPGQKIHEQIERAIEENDKLLLILSEHSMASDWVGTEIANAREREAREEKQLLFPVTIAPFEKVKQWKLYDSDRGKDSAREIREYFIPDFSEWKKHDTYQAALGQLVKGLKAGSNA